MQSLYLDFDSFQKYVLKPFIISGLNFGVQCKKKGSFYYPNFLITVKLPVAEKNYNGILSNKQRKTRTTHSWKKEL